MASTKPNPDKRLLTALIVTVVFVASGFYPVDKFLPIEHRLSQELTYQNASDAKPENWNAFLNDQKNTIFEQARLSKPPLDKSLKVKSDDALHQLTLNLPYPSNQDLTDPFRKLIKKYKNTFIQSQKKQAAQNLLNTPKPKAPTHPAVPSSFDQDIRSVMRDLLEQQLEDRKILEEVIEKIETDYAELSVITDALIRRQDHSNLDEHVDFSRYIEPHLDQNMQTDFLLPQLRLILEKVIEQIRIMDYQVRIMDYQAAKVKSREDRKDIDRKRYLLNRQLIDIEDEIAQREKSITERTRKHDWPIYLMGLKTDSENNHQQLESYSALKEIKAASLRRVIKNIEETRTELKNFTSPPPLVTQPTKPAKSIFLPTLKLPIPDIQPKKTSGFMRLMALA
ncbi:MAG: hypothetical protein IID32_08580, partial [Planctomycetes bacterium]|nr:hypothetical protein [Planctomycetota bacterium]